MPRRFPGSALVLLLTCTGTLALAAERLADPATTLVARVVAGQSLHRQQWTQSQGLSHPLVQSAIQDRRGFLWVATNEGLDRLDGQEVQTFHRGLDPAYDLRGSQVAGLLEDPAGAIWVLMAEGILSRFDPSTETLEHFTPDGVAMEGLRFAFRTLVGDPHGGLLFGSNRGPWRFDPQTQEFSALADAPGYPTDPLHHRVFALTVTSGDGLLVGTAGGLIGRLADGSWQILLEKVQVNALVPAPSGWWVGTDRGLLLLSRQYQVLRRWRGDPTGPLSHDNVVGLYPTGGNPAQGVWVGSQTGLDLVMNHSGRVFPVSLGMSRQRRVTPLLIDHEGALWSGVRGVGLIRLNPHGRAFIHYSLEHRGNDRPAPVLGLGTDRQGTVWIGTWGSGLYRLPTDASTPQPVPSAVVGKTIAWIVEDPTGRLWIGSYDRGLSRREPDEEHFVPVRAGSAWPDPAPVIESLALDPGGYLWIGTRTRGLYRHRLEDGHTVHYRHRPDDPASLSSSHILAIYQDRADTLWVGTDNGLNRYRPDSDDFQRFIHDPKDPTSISDNFVKNILMDDQGRIWVATNLGLNRLDPDTGRFQVYTVAEGLPHNRVNNLIQDRLGYLWLGTANGLSRFDPASLRFQNFGPEEGLPGRLLFYPAVTAGADGRLYFGGPDGLVALDPGDFSSAASGAALPPVLTGLRLFNHPLAIAPDTLLPGAPHGLRELNLSHHQDMLTLEFVAPEFSLARGQRYRYRLEGVDESWLETAPGERSATYTGLDPGRYRFQVQAAIGDGPWLPPQPQGLGIIVAPPWWATLWFRALLLGLGLGLLVGAYRWRTWAITQRNEQLQREVDQRTSELAAEIAQRRCQEQRLREARDAAEAASRAKSLFLATISHELRTPLNNILGFTHLLPEQGALTPEQRRATESIQRNGQYLYSHIKDLLDVTRVEADRLSLTLGLVELDQLLAELTNPTRFHGQAKGVVLSWRIAPLPAVLSDGQRLRQVVDNLLDNALKYTDQGEVVLSVQPLGGEPGELGEQLGIRFKVQDTGPGIPSEHLQTVLELFEQVHPTTQGNRGLGLGLYLCWRLVALLGGELFLQSRVAGGEWASTASDPPTPPDQPHGTVAWFDLWLTPTGDPRPALESHRQPILEAHMASRQTPPQETLEALRTVLASGDIRALIAQAETLLAGPAYGTFRDQVLELAREFRLNELRCWLDRC